MTEEAKRTIEAAVWYWTEKLNGRVFWWDKSPEPTKEWCTKQIEYFSKMLKQR